MSKTKICTKCLKEKSLDEFPYRETGRYKKSAWCRLCTNIMNKQTPEESKRYRKTYLSKEGNLEKERTRTREKARLVRLDVLDHYGNKCECCKEGNKEFLAIDHIDGKGKLSKFDTGIRLFNRLRREKYPAGFRILCHNCNMSLGMYGYCPHQIKETSDV
jgi:hypothetical protein